MTRNYTERYWRPWEFSLVYFACVQIINLFKPNDSLDLFLINWVHQSQLTSQGVPQKWEGFLGFEIHDFGILGRYKILASTFWEFH